ncbi:MAG: ATP-binding protein [Methanomassiliicoccaceae archaeon]|jgi:predicted AAA+ superfamily ATPase|nr:ATP-binding protein [Methanomassiliicoccaceae archaeon]
MNNRVNVERKLYTEQLKKYVNTEFVKVITGIRRSGKSSVLELFQKDILELTDREHIIYINFEDVEYDHIKEYKKLHEYVLSRIRDERTYYLFLDEIQNVTGWEKCVNSLRLRNIDIYLTGSNSNLLSSELATLLAGRYVQFRLYTLSFEEFIRFRKEYGVGSDDIDSEMDAYIKIGGFPGLSVGIHDHQTARRVVADINDSVIRRDVLRRKNIRNEQLFESVISFIYDNIGNITTAKNIADHLKGQRRSADIETVYNYLQYLEEALVTHKVQRYDIRGKRLMETFEKYYLADHSLQYTVREYNEKNLPGILENIVYLELLRRGYAVGIGKFDNKEVDFVAERPDGKVYVQVCYKLGSERTTEREIGTLLKIRDNYPKLVVVYDKLWQIERDGVRGIHLKDFLLSDRW